MYRVPGFVWSRVLRAEGAKSAGRLDFMGPDHHVVRDLVVSEMRAGRPIAPERISEASGLSPSRVDELVSDLEQHLTFLYRSDGRNVDWAYPVAAAETPHRIRLDSGERLFGA
jgi:hypothetical protein